MAFSLVENAMVLIVEENSECLLNNWCCPARRGVYTAATHDFCVDMIVGYLLFFHSLTAVSLDRDSCKVILFLKSLDLILNGMDPSEGVVRICYQ